MTTAAGQAEHVQHWLRYAGLEALLYIVGSVLLARAIGFIGDTVTRRIDEDSRAGDALVRSESAKHRHAVAQVLQWVAIVLVYSVTTVVVLGRLGVPLTSLVAPATVAGVALGFGAQRIVQDILAGFFILTERQYGFGDVVTLSPLGSAGVTGTVEDVTLRTTRLRSANGEVIVVPNGQITQVVNSSRDWARAVVDVPVPSSADLNEVNDLLRQVCLDAYGDDSLRPLLLDKPTVMGVESLGLDTLKVRVVARTLPGKQFEVGRDLRIRIAFAFRQHGLDDESLTTASTSTEPA